jgi:glycine/D-amino acid oxidase-like deaminating enzyme
MRPVAYGPPPRRAVRSWWLEEALADEPGEPCPPLEGDVNADVVVMGGGYTGMWAAHFLKQRDPGIDVALVERDICGGGPSGRNGGFCNGLFEELPLLIRLAGREAALQIHDATERSVFEIGEWCDRNGVDAWFTATGHIGVATSEAQDGAWRELVEVARSVGMAEGHAIELSPEDVADRCRSPVFRGGLFIPKAATVQPARLARGLRRVLLEQGVRIFERTPVRRFRSGPPVEVEAREGTVRGRTGILATGAYMAAHRRFRGKIVPRGSYIVVTAPAPERLEEIGWTGGEGVYDYRTALHYLRTTPDGRIAFGGASSRAGVGTGMGPRLDFDGVTVAGLVRDLHRFFPSFADVPIEAGWGGPIDVSGLHLPFFGTLPRDTIHYGVGFTGGGVGPCHLAGRILSGMALGVEDEHTTLPIVRIEPKAFPPDPFLSVGAMVASEAFVRRDRALDEGRRPNPVIDFIAHLPRRLGYEIGP